VSPLLVLVAAILYVGTVALFTLAVRRLLGVQVSVVRAGVATLIALTVTRPVLDALVTEPATPTSELTEQLLYVTLLGAVTFVLAMVMIVVAEVLVPVGSVPGPIDLWRGWRSRLSRSGRYLEILRIAWRHGLSRFLRGRRHLSLGTVAERRDLARSLRRALEDGGVTFVKLGQQLSTRHDLLPAEFVSELSRLQDQAAPIPWEEAAEVVRAETGRDLDELFDEIDEQPLAAASVAQVHGARLRTGERVVVKVQRPGIERDVERDLNILVRLASMLDSRADWGRSIGLLDLARGFAAALTEELDFTVERDNMRGVAAALEHSAANGIRVPRPVDELSTSRVLVMERLDGVPLTGAETTLARPGRRFAAGSPARCWSPSWTSFWTAASSTWTSTRGTSSWPTTARSACSTSGRSDVWGQRRGGPWASSWRASAPVTRWPPRRRCSSWSNVRRRSTSVRSSRPSACSS